MTSTPSSPSKKYDSTNQANVKVVVRIRPLINAELSNKFENVTEAISDHMLVFDPKVQQIEGFLHTQRRNITGRRFKDLKYAFDNVLRSSAKNRDVFEKSTQSIVKTVLMGYNCSVFAYGATGSGKTHTMLGNENEPGVIYHTMLDLYKQIDALKDEKIFNVAVSYLEVYNETVRDLLNPKKNLPIREDKMAGVMIAGLSLHKPECAEDLLHMLHHGNKNRSQHPTDANAESSRSHAVFQVFVKQRSRTGGNSQVQMAKMCLVDLAGSERAIHTRNVGARFREGANINRSLLALGNVINALAAKSKGHIPYRDSKLTRLLKDSLGGNCQTVMIATISPSSRSYEDTYNTLRYADRAKHIKADLTKNIVNVDQHIVNYKIYVADLERENRDLREKARLLQESTTITTAPSSVSVMKQIQDRMLDLFKSRKDIMRTQITSEVVKRELKWKRSRKERAIKRVETLSDMKDVVSKHQRKVERMQCRYLKEEVNLQKTTQQLKQHDQSIYRLNTELANLVNSDKASREHLAMCMRFYVTDSYLCDLDMHLCFVKKMARAQERQSVVNERIVLSLIQLVRKQQDILKGHNLSSPEVEKAYKDCCYLVEERGVAWVQQPVTKAKSDSHTGVSTLGNKENGAANLLDDEDLEDLRISDIIDIQLPKIALDSLKLGSIGSPPKKKSQQQPNGHMPQTASLDEMVMTSSPGHKDLEVQHKLGLKVAWHQQDLKQEQQRQQQLPFQSFGELERQAGSPSSTEPTLQKGPQQNLLLCNVKKSKSTNSSLGGSTKGNNDFTNAPSTVLQQTPYKKSFMSALSTDEMTPQKQGNPSMEGGEGGSLNNACPNSTSASSSSNKDQHGLSAKNSKTIVSGSVKKMVEKYSSNNGLEVVGLNNPVAVHMRNNSIGSNNAASCKRSLYNNAGPQQLVESTDPTCGVNSTGLVQQKQPPRQIITNATGGSSLKQQTNSTDTDNKEGNENDNTPTSDKLNETFEIDKPAIPNTPCIDGPVPKQRRLTAGNTPLMIAGGGSVKKQNSSQLQVATPVLSCQNNHSNSYQQRFLQRQQFQTSSSPGISAADKPFSRRLSFVSSTNNSDMATNITEQKEKFGPETPNGVSKKNAPFIYLSANNEQKDDSDSNEAVFLKAGAMETKSHIPRELEKLQKLSKFRATSSPSRFHHHHHTPTPQQSSSPSSSSQTGVVVKSSPCLTKWDLMRERGVTRGSKLWKSLSAQQLGMCNNNNSSVDGEDGNGSSVSPNTSTSIVMNLLDQEVKSSTPLKMEVEVCISPKPSAQQDEDGANGSVVGPTSQTDETKTIVKTPELNVNPYMQTVIRSLKKHGLPSLTERLSLLPGSISSSSSSSSQGTIAPAPVSSHLRERSPLRLLDANSNKYQFKRPLGNTNQNKSNTLLSDKQQPKKMEPFSLQAAALPNTTDINSLDSVTSAAPSITKYRLDRTRDRRHHRDLAAKPYSRETILASRGRRLEAALKRNNSLKEIVARNQDPPPQDTNSAVTGSTTSNSSNTTTAITTTAKPSYMLSTFAASQRATGLPGREKTSNSNNGGNNNNNNKLSSWSIVSQQAMTTQQPPQRRLIGQRNKSYLPWLQS